MYWDCGASVASINCKPSDHVRNGRHDLRGNVCNVMIVSERREDLELETKGFVRTSIVDQFSVVVQYMSRSTGRTCSTNNGTSLIALCYRHL